MKKQKMAEARCGGVKTTEKKGDDKPAKIIKKFVKKGDK